MTVNKIKINLNQFKNSESIFIDIPISNDNTPFGVEDLIEKEFIEKEVEKAINPIIDNDKVRFKPVDNNGVLIESIIYKINMLNDNGEYINKYGLIGFNDDDIKFRKNNFKLSFLKLNYYDSPNQLKQTLVDYNTIYSRLNKGDYITLEENSIIAGKPRPAIEIPINMVVNDINIGFSEGFNIYDYKDSLEIGETKYIYLRTSFNNSKTGSNTNMMVKSFPLPIEDLVNELYIKIKLFRNDLGRFYCFDNTYQGNGEIMANNISYDTNKCIINLYQINAI